LTQDLEIDLISPILLIASGVAWFLSPRDYA